MCRSRHVELERLYDSCMPFDRVQRERHKECRSHERQDSLYKLEIREEWLTWAGEREKKSRESRTCWALLRENSAAHIVQKVQQLYQRNEFRLARKYLHEILVYTRVCTVFVFTRSNNAFTPPCNSNYTSTFTFEVTEKNASISQIPAKRSGPWYILLIHFRIKIFILRDVEKWPIARKFGANSSIARLRYFQGGNGKQHQLFSVIVPESTIFYRLGTVPWHSKCKGLSLISFHARRKKSSHRPFQNRTTFEANLVLHGFFFSQLIFRPN